MKLEQRRIAQQRYDRSPKGIARQRRHLALDHVRGRLPVVAPYGLTLDEYHAIFEAQGERCAICRREFDLSAKRAGPHVDHNHTTGQPRGLLCHACNVGIGQMNDDVNIVRRAVMYLERHA